jgi:hypothetical protein
MEQIGDAVVCSLDGTAIGWIAIQLCNNSIINN